MQTSCRRLAGRASHVRAASSGTTTSGRRAAAVGCRNSTGLEGSDTVEAVTRCLEGRFTQGVNLLLSW